MIAHTDLGDTPFRRSRKLKELINDGGVQWGGNKKLKIYGTLNCASGKRMKVGNRVFFQSEQEAKGMDYRPCAHCMRQEYLLWKAETNINTSPLWEAAAATQNGLFESCVPDHIASGFVYLQHNKSSAGECFQASNYADPKTTFSMKKNLSLLFAFIAWFAVIAQFVLMIENRSAPIFETIIRFFSFFTILTNTLVAIYFTLLTFNLDNKNAAVNKPGTLTAITVYIFMVGSVYQVVLRAIWKPEGMQLIVNELLHSVIPVLVTIFWALYENKKAATFRQIPKWAIYPLAYLVYILIRGSFSNFYPYPFVSVSEIGMAKTLINSAILVLVFFLIAALFVFTGKYFSKKQQAATAA